MIKQTLAAAMMVASIATSASAWVADDDGNGHPLYWRTNGAPVSYLLVRNNVPEGTVGENAVHRAFASWNDAAANLQYRFAGYENAGAQNYDGKNFVYWQYEGWSEDPSLAAITYRYYDTTDGHLLDADIVFNGERYSWSTTGTGYDIENSATHEVGHMSGLGHSDDAEATMYAETSIGETKKRSLANDDLAGFGALYTGTAVATGTTRGSVAGVTTDRSGITGVLNITANDSEASELVWLASLLAVLAARRLAALREAN